MPGLVNEYAKRPGDPCTSNYKKHLDKKMSLTESQEKLYYLPSITSQTRELGRTRYNMPMRVPYESLHREFSEDASLSLKLRAAIDNNELPPSYHNNPIVSANPAYTVMPCGLYLDGLPYYL